MVEDSFESNEEYKAIQYPQQLIRNNKSEN